MLRWCTFRRQLRELVRLIVRATNPPWICRDFRAPLRVRNLQTPCSLYGKPIGSAVALRIQRRAHVCVQMRVLRFGFCRSEAFRETTLQHASRGISWPSYFASIIVIRPRFW
jgi:hypothetical protein